MLLTHCLVMRPFDPDSTTLSFHPTGNRPQITQPVKTTTKCWPQIIIVPPYIAESLIEYSLHYYNTLQLCHRTLMHDYCAADSLFSHSCLGNSDTKKSLESLTLYTCYNYYIGTCDDLYLVKSGILSNHGNSLKMCCSCKGSVVPFTPSSPCIYFQGEWLYIIHITTCTEAWS